MNHPFKVGDVVEPIPEKCNHNVYFRQILNHPTYLVYSVDTFKKEQEPNISVLITDYRDSEEFTKFRTFLAERFRLKGD